MSVCENAWHKSVMCYTQSSFEMQSPVCSDRKMDTFPGGANDKVITCASLMQFQPCKRCRLWGHMLTAGKSDCLSGVLFVLQHAHRMLDCLNGVL